MSFVVPLTKLSPRLLNAVHGFNETPVPLKISPMRVDKIACQSKQKFQIQMAPISLAQTLPPMLIQIYIFNFNIAIREIKPKIAKQLIQGSIES